MLETGLNCCMSCKFKTIVWPVSGVEKVLDLLRDFDYGVRVHFTNVSSGKVIEAIKEAQNDGLEVNMFININTMTKKL